MAFFNEFPHTRTYDSDLGWLIEEYKKHSETLEDITAWMATYQPTIENLNTIYTEMMAGNIPPAMVDAIETWLNQYGILSESKSYTDEKTDAITLQLEAEIAARMAADSGLQAQIDELIAPSGTAPNPAEIENARIGVDGTTYSTLGESIRTQITNVENTIDTLKPIAQPDNLMPATYTDNAYVEITNGEILTNRPGYFASDFIPVKNTLKYVCNAGRNWAFYNKNYVFVSGGNTRLTDSAPFRVPFTAAYMRISVNKASDGVNNPSGLYFREYLAQPEPVNKIEHASLVFGTQFPNNLFDPSQIEENAYVRVEDGATTSNNNYFNTWYIPVTAGTTYRANYGRNFAWYDSDKNFISGVSGASITQGVIAPPDAAYIRFSINKTTDTDNPTDIYFTSEGNYNPTTEIPGLAVNNWTNGKRFIWNGDSITAGTANFDNIAAAKLGMIETDYAINGSTISLAADGSDSRNAIVARYASMAAGDIVGIAAGTNDWMYAWAPIGDESSTSNSTFYGALKNLCEGLITKYPTARIFFVTPIQRAQPFADGNGGTYTPDGSAITPYSKNKYGLTLRDYCDIIIKVCGSYSIPVLDLNREAGLTPFVSAQAAYFDSVLTHPNSQGQNILARRFTAWLKDLSYNI